MTYIYNVYIYRIYIYIYTCSMQYENVKLFPPSFLGQFTFHKVVTRTP